MLVVRDVGSFNQMMQDLWSSDFVGFDTETTGLNPHHDELLLMSFATFNQHYVVVVPKIGRPVLQQLAPFFDSDDVDVVMHNAAFDMKFVLKNFGVMVKRPHCTYIVEQVLKAGLRSQGFSLAEVAARRVGVQLDKAVRAGFLDREDRSFSREELEYAALDAAVLLPIYEQQIVELDAENLGRVYDLEMQLLSTTVNMEYTGIKMNRAKLLEARPVVQGVIDRADVDIQDQIIRGGGATAILFSKDGYSAVNTGSPKQMLEAFQRMGIQVDSLSKKTLAEWDSTWQSKRRQVVDPDDDFHVGFSHPLLRMHAVRTAAAKLKGTYIDGILAESDPETGRVYPGFKQCGAVATGRYSSVKPNFQNLPQGNKLKDIGLEEYDIRSMVVSDSGKLFIIADYSGIELVILAAMSDDENLLHQILQGDIHSYVANSLFGDEIERVLGSVITQENRKNKELPFSFVRDLFKPVSYGIVYGSTGWNLYRTLSSKLASVNFHITPETADSWVERWKHELFPKTGQLLSDNARNAVTRGYTQSALGRRRRWDLDEIRRQRWMYEAAMREGMNQPIQSSSADMIKLAMLRVSRALDPRRGRIALTVHDEIVAEVDADYAAEAVSIIQCEMESAGYYLFPNLPAGAIVAEPKQSTKYDK